MADAAGPAALRSPALCRFFGGVMARQMRRNFHAVRLARPGWPELPAGRPAIVYLNHPSWWDPAFLIVMGTTRFRDRPGFGPIDARMLARYPFMGRIGLFGVEKEGLHGMASFLRTGEALLRDPSAMLWITAEGDFTDPRRRPVSLKPGLAQLIRRVPDAVVVPLAVEYPFWDERTPEALARFGSPMDGAGLAHESAADATARLQWELEATMDALARDAQSRDPARFTTLVGGTVGVGGIYDLWRRGRAWAAGKPFHPGHGAPES
ncbi:lysophospholipid acyltransferase family protein [Azospirillum sp. SYSU D00513]|uniref:lysophospholipid acyltransferase family protein n=1 Tax=Azospirillum sp. SYSU D00513 TaxID=2812561 RepID=UPI001A975E13|nr:lysophospholipid acyltransferase family protein [Azospirillum sp. SYSU D00513]